MPLYEYECDKCETVTQEIQRFDDPKEMPCSDEKCPGTRHRKMSPGTFHLKGSGWANDGYSEPTS